METINRRTVTTVTTETLSSDPVLEKHYSFDVQKLRALINENDTFTHVVIQVTLPTANDKPGAVEKVEAMQAKNLAAQSEELSLQRMERGDGNIQGYVCPNPPGY